MIEFSLQEEKITFKHIEKIEKIFPRIFISIG